MRDEEETATLRRGIRADLIIAVCALMISMAATAASWWQSRVVAQQLSAQVWPYLSISTTYDAESITVEILNNGLGPAIIRSTVLTIDGKPIANPLQGLLTVVPRRTGKQIHVQLAGLGPGDVIRASSSLRLFRLTPAWDVPVFARNAKRINLTVCYCSLLGNCWQTSANQDGDPAPLPRCAAVGNAQFTVPVVIPR